VKFTLRNLARALADQTPPDRNSVGIFSERSHLNRNGKAKIEHATKEGALKHAASLHRQNGVEYAAYKCIFCNGYHVGANG
jgi:hypothetical protein